MKEKEFVNLKIDWLIKNNRIELIESFLNQNQEFASKDKAVQFLVDKNIAQADIKNGCEKIKFIDKKIKDSYLEKFKIYCLIFNNKKSQAQLLHDILKEQKQIFQQKLLGMNMTRTDPHLFHWLNMMMENLNISSHLKISK